MPRLSHLLKTKEAADNIVLNLDLDKQLLEALSDLIKMTKQLDEQQLMSGLRQTMRIKQGLSLNLLKQINSHLGREIDSVNKIYHKANQSWCSYVNSLSYEEHRRFIASYYPNNEAIDEFFLERIKQNSDWRSLCLLWNMDSYDVLPKFFGFYPIYVADKFLKDWLSEMEQSINPQQMKKIRTFTQDEAYDDLPKNAIGFIATKNHFTHLSRDAIYDRLVFLSSLLREGGTIGFNFNDSELSYSAELVENKSRSFVLGSDIQNILAELGLEISIWENIKESSTTWVEAKKPGTFESIKVGETLGRILEKIHG